jgi:CubicO group peptidase (beta-lactamase class C family)
VPFIKLDKYCTLIVPEQTPGIVCWVGTKKHTLFMRSFGFAQRVPSHVAVNNKTIFDLASLTKPLTTAIATMICVEEGSIRLHDPVTRFLGVFKNTPHHATTIAQLLTHTSGLPAWFPMYILPERSRIHYLAHARTSAQPVVYSCLGYILLGKIIEQATGSTLDKFCTARIYTPFELSSLCFLPRTRRNCAATEKGDHYERNMIAEYCDPSARTWRDRVIRGEVHDGNCFYAYSGCAGNAGLFGNAEDCSRFLQLFCQGSIVSKKYVALMTRDHTGGPEKRGLGWWMDPFPGILSRHSFAHTGFTGTMVCVDPLNDIMIVLLTNAIHPRVRQEIKRRIRRKVVQIVAETLLTRGTKIRKA